MATKYAEIQADLESARNRLSNSLPADQNLVLILDRLIEVAIELDHCKQDDNVVPFTKTQVR